MKNKIYLISYYLIFIIFTLTLILLSYAMRNDSYVFFDPSLIVLCLYLINIFLILFFTLFLIMKRKLLIRKKDILLNFSFIIFIILIIICVLLMNKYVLYSMIHFEYYCELMMIPLTLINVYNLFNIDYKKISDNNRWYIIYLKKEF